MTAPDGVLQAGERVLWEGRPQQGLMFRSRDAVMIPFGLVWTGIVASAAFHALRLGSANFGALVLLAFLIFGLYMLVGRFLVDAYIRWGTYYGITDRRLLIASGLWRHETRSLFLDRLPEMRLSQNSNGRGTIKFGSDPPMNRMSWTGSPVPAFEGIEDVVTVYHLILDAQKSASART